MRGAGRASAGVLARCGLASLLAADGWSWAAGSTGGLLAHYRAVSWASPSCSLTCRTCLCEHWEGRRSAVRPGSLQLWDAPLSWLQAAATRPLLAGHNLVLAAETGSGKTLAYLAPLLSNMLQRRADDAATAGSRCDLARVCGGGPACPPVRCVHVFLRAALPGNLPNAVKPAVALNSQSDLWGLLGRTNGGHAPSALCAEAQLRLNGQGRAGQAASGRHPCAVPQRGAVPAGRPPS